MGGRLGSTQSIRCQVPGAGQYQHKETIGRGAVSKSIGERRDIQHPKGELGPGPGGYYNDKVKNNNISHS